MNRFVSSDRFVALVCSISIVLLGTVFFFAAWESTRDNADTTELTPLSTTLAPFASAEEYRQFMIDQDTLQQDTFNASAGLGIAAPSMNRELMGESDAAIDESSSATQRVSETNVQVKGIDEPDIVKTNGEHLFISSGPFYAFADDLKLRALETVESSIDAPDIGIGSSPSILPTPVSGLTRLVKAQPADQLTQTSTITRGGNLLVSDNTMIVLEDTEFTGYNISQPTNPTQLWNISFQDYVVSTRLIDGTIYAVTSQTASSSSPCPLEPAITDTQSITIPCDRIYHPPVESSVDTTYSILAINASTGKVTDTVSFLANSASATVYVSPESAYVALTLSQDTSTFYLDFYRDKALSLFPVATQQKIQTVLGYTLSTAAKMTELEVIMSSYAASLPEAQQEQFAEAFSERLTSYTDEHTRDLIQTGITKVSLDTLDVVAQGAVPGQLLNQFSLDEFEDHLRVATTSGSSWFLGSGTATNDIYVLNGDLKQTGALIDLGLDETIHSARFVGDRGYLVTFKQTDPFFVLDLSNPNQPQLAGELKLPGFSSYLDPLTDSLVLGIGQENGSVKLSLFDVSSASQPRELQTVLLNEYWSEAQSNHHAFLHDAKHQAFFLPGGSTNGGFIFSYANNELTQLAKAGTGQAKRAVYINDVLYVISDTSIVTLDETTWEQLGEYTLPQ